MTNGMDFSALTWFKSTRSSGNGECVTCARVPGDGMAVKDSKDPGGPVLLFDAEAWRTFAQRVKRGEL